MKNYAAKLMFRTVQFFAYLFFSGLCKIICIEMQPKLSHLINIPANFPMFPRFRARYFICMHPQQVHQRCDAATSKLQRWWIRRGKWPPSPQHLFLFYKLFGNEESFKFLSAFFQPYNLKKKIFLVLSLGPILVVVQPQRKYVGWPIQSCHLHNWVWLALTANWAKNRGYQYKGEDLKMRKNNMCIWQLNLKKPHFTIECTWA